MFLFFLLALASAEWVIKLEPGVGGRDFAQAHGLDYVGPFTVMPTEENYHIFHAHRTRAMQRIVQSKEVQWAEEQHMRPRVFPRGVDPMADRQWNLHGGQWSLDTDQIPANLTGKDVIIGIVDDGLQHEHPEIAPNYVAAHSWNFNANTADPTPLNNDDMHGTSSAGVAAAAQLNNHCGRGVAPEAKIAGIRVIAEPVSDMVEASALTFHVMGSVDIVSCSWGPDDDGMIMAGPGLLTERAMALYSGALRGRLGKGTIYVWASGNGRDNGDTCGFDGYASSPFVIPVGAIDRNGDRAWYSEGCAALMAVAPSSGAGMGIITADLMGPRGYSPTECTDQFGGTSAAAPMASGIIALMLQKRPELTWRDVKHIIAKGAVPIHTTDGGWNINTAGYKHSHEYGFGLLKLLPLLREVERHTLVTKDYKLWTSGMQIIHAPSGYMPLTIVVPVNGTGITFIEHVRLTCSLDHTNRGSLTIDLQSPQGTISHLAEARHYDHNRNYPAGGWTFTSVRHWGETQSNGNWRIIIGDTNPRTSGKNHFHGYVLNIMGM